MAEFQIDTDMLLDEWAARIIDENSSLRWPTSRSMAKQIRQQVQQATLQEMGEWVAKTYLVTGWGHSGYWINTKDIETLQRGKMPRKE